MRRVDTSAPVLVTGATGFIGRRVVRHLLAGGRSVLAMARPKEGIPAHTRVLQAVGQLSNDSRLEVIEAVPTRSGTSLTPAVLRRLQHTVETVLHCAGDTTFFPEDLGRFRASHIEAPLALLTALHGGRLQRWGHLSTAYVCGKRSGTVYEDEGDVGQEFRNPYERVKLAAEHAVREAGDRLGLDVRVFRPSAVVGAAPATAGGQPSQLFFTFVRLLEALARLPHTARLHLRIKAAPRARFNIVPVEYVVQALVALAEHPAGVNQTLHLVVSDAPSQETMLAMLADYFGLTGLSVIEARSTPLENPSALERKVARLLSGYRDYLTQDLHFDDRGTRRLLDPLGLARPTLFPEDVSRLIDQALLCPVPLYAGGI